MKTLLKKSFPFHAGPKAEGYLLSASDLWNTPLSLWGLSRVSIAEDAEILEIGCGGGKNLERLLKKAPKGHVSGIDTSFRAVDFAYRQNEKAIRAGRCSVYEGAPMCFLSMKRNLTSSWQWNPFISGRIRKPA